MTLEASNRSRHMIAPSIRLLVVMTVVLFTSAKVMADDARMNVLFLISDDLNTSLGCYGHPLVKSPNIDRLAARGVRFERAYCQYPLCGPSRNSMLTGLYPNSTGILTNSQIFRQSIPHQHSLSQAFRLDGYFAARIGKLYHYQVPKGVGTNGHDDPGSWELELNPAGCDRLIEEPEIFTLRPGNFGGTLSWYASPRGDSEHTDGMLARDAEWVLERCAKESRPFFLAVGFYRPHTPYVAPEEYFTHYSKEDMPIVQGVEEDVQDLPEDALGSHKKEHALLNDDLRQQAKQAYYASIEFMDAQVGYVLNALERNGLADNTIVVFTSDHGYHLGEHGLWQKMSLFEESARVPLIIAPPSLTEPGVVSESLVGLVDLAPTLLEVCGVPAPENLQGQSLVPMLKDHTHKGRGWSLTQVRRGKGPAKQTFGYTLRTAHWRYTEWDGGDRGRELYDHKADPLEQTNLAQVHAHTDTLVELSHLMNHAVASTLPESGDIPRVSLGTWTPNLTDP